MRPIPGIRCRNTRSEEYEKVMTSQEAQILTELMTGVVESGTASSLSGRGYTVAGKTGTAEHGDVSQTTPHSWFVGFSNVEDPDLVVCVIAEGRQAPEARWPCPLPGRFLTHIITADGKNKYEFRGGSAFRLPCRRILTVAQIS